MTLDDWRRSGRHFDFKGRTIFYHDDGAGDALLCLHGFPTASWDWQALWPSLTDRFRVVAPDLLGFGYSAKPLPFPYTFDLQADLAEALLAHLGLSRIHVLAHDYGDTVAQELLARHLAGTSPLVLRSVCLLNGGLFPEATTPRPIQKLLKGPLGPLIARFLTERTFSRSFSAVFGRTTLPTDAELADFWRLICFNNGVRVAPALSRYQDERRHRRHRWVGALQATTVPLRFINGPLDPVSGAGTIDRYRTLVPDPDVVVLDGIGHYPQVEAPERVAEAFLAFIDRLGPAGGPP